MAPQLSIEDVATLLALAKTAKIDVADSPEVGKIIERAEVVVVLARLTQASAPAEPAAPAPDLAPA